MRDPCRKSLSPCRCGAVALFIVLFLFALAEANAAKVRAINVWGHKIAAGMNLREVEAALGNPIASVETESVFIEAYGISEVMGHPVPLPSRGHKQLRTWVLIFERKTNQLVASMALVDDVRQEKPR
ncbi:hypothetical protein [Verrucomicrobium sp. 3C]|uniref:hypothetical protein n=1 Tax=Verrucomicrobium sp. 3C TaxID=1134055 RepID=UPI000360067F|nr:hypothetical protein [Verrucomicrobium sp. 3C]